jgi:hypothetical protein
MAKSKLPPLVSHILDSAHWDKDAILLPPIGQGRLVTTFVAKAGGWDTVARVIRRSSHAQRVYFPDANIAFRDDTESVWNELRVAALSSRNGSVALAEPVQAEMEEWLKDPRRNAERAKDIRTALA